MNQLANRATPSIEYDYDWCTNRRINRVLESYIHIVLRGEDLVAITENDFTFDEVGSTCKKNIGVLVWKHRQT